MVTHSPTHRLHEALDGLVGKVAQIDQDALTAAVAHRAGSAAAGQDSVSEEMTAEGGR